MSETGPAFDFSARIIPFEQIPDRLTEHTKGRIEIEIAGDQVLKYGEHTVTIRPDTFALNSLLLAGGGWTTFAHLKDTVGFPYTSPNFTRRMNILNDQLEQLTGVADGVRRQGEGRMRVARLSPQFFFREGRSNRDNRWLQLGVVSISETKVTFESLEQRRAVLGKLFKELSTDKGVLRESHRLYQESLRLREDSEMSPDIVYEYLMNIEKAVVTFLTTDSQKLTDADRESLHCGAVAYHSLYMSVEPMVKRICYNAGYRFSGLLTDEMLQAARLGVLKTILNFGHERDLEEGVAYFYAYCNDVIRGEIGETVLKFVTAHRHLHHREYYLRDRILKAQWQLSQDNIDGTIDNIVKEIGDPEVTAEKVEKCLKRMGEGTVYPDGFEKGWSGFYDSSFIDYEEAENNRIVDNIIFGDAIRQLFEHPELSSKEKVMISLSHGVWSPMLRGHVVHNPNPRGGEPFEYPDTQEAFDEIVKGEAMPFRHMARILPYTNRGIGLVVERALEKARDLIENPL